MNLLYLSLYLCISLCRVSGGGKTKKKFQKKITKCVAVFYLFCLSP